MDRKILNAVLAKLEVESPENLKDDRAVQKLNIRIEKLGLPKDLTDEESALVGELTKPGNDTPAEPKAGKKAKAKKSYRDDEPVLKEISRKTKSGKTKIITDGEGEVPAKKGKADKAPKAEKKAKAPRADGKEKGSDVFSELISKVKDGAYVEAKKSDVVEAIMTRAGLTAASAKAYVVWAKGKPGDKVYNHFDFRITEEKRDGVKYIKRNGTPKAAK